jgi:hypothetical protein
VRRFKQEITQTAEKRMIKVLRRQKFYNISDFVKSTINTFQKKENTGKSICNITRFPSMAFFQSRPSQPVQPTIQHVWFCLSSFYLYDFIAVESDSSARKLEERKIQIKDEKMKIITKQ